MDKAIKKFFSSPKRGLALFTINYDGSVDVVGNITIFPEDPVDGQLPIRFGAVYGNFNCAGSGLVSLCNGMPKKVEGDFDCSRNRFVSLKGAPKQVGGAFICENHCLFTLDGAPEEVGGDVRITGNLDYYTGFDPVSRTEVARQAPSSLRSLNGFPAKVGGSIDVSTNILTSLEGCPEEVNGDFCCAGNRLRTLAGGPKRVNGHVCVAENQLTTLIGGPEFVKGCYDCRYNMLKDLKGCPSYAGGTIETVGNLENFSFDGCCYPEKIYNGL